MQQVLSFRRIASANLHICKYYIGLCFTCAILDEYLSVIHIYSHLCCLKKYLLPPGRKYLGWNQNGIKWSTRLIPRLPFLS